MLNLLPSPSFPSFPSFPSAGVVVGVVGVFPSSPFHQFGIIANQEKDESRTLRHRRGGVIDGGNDDAFFGRRKGPPEDDIRHVYNVAGPPYLDSALIQEQIGGGFANPFPDDGDDDGGAGGTDPLSPNLAHINSWYKNFYGDPSFNSVGVGAGDGVELEVVHEAEVPMVKHERTKEIPSDDGQKPRRRKPQQQQQQLQQQQQQQHRRRKKEEEQEEQRRRRQQQQQQQQRDRRRRLKEREEELRLKQDEMKAMEAERAKRRTRLLRRLRKLRARVRRLQAQRDRLKEDYSVEEEKTEEEEFLLAPHTTFADALGLDDVDVGDVGAGGGGQEVKRYGDDGDVFSPFLDLVVGDTYSSASRRDISNALVLWFKRSVFLLLAIAAFTLSPGLFIVTIVLAVVFETLLNVTRARNDYLEFLDTYHYGLTQLPSAALDYDESNWRYILGLPPDFWMEEELAADDAVAAASSTSSSWPRRGPKKFVKYRVLL